jgi:uracil-DNA glycosylase
MNPKKFVELLGSKEKQDNIFNPFRDKCSDFDIDKAPEVRKQNLISFLEAQVKNKPRTLWVAEAPGYNGSRRSGLFLISERDFEEVSKKIGSKNFKKATKGEVKTAMSVNIMWNFMKSLSEFPLTFNVLPFHPYKKGKQFSNRTPTKKEIDENIFYLEVLIDWFKPKKIIGIGRKAHEALEKKGIKNVYVRHPSHGGKNEFLKKMKELYQMKS